MSFGESRANHQVAHAAMTLKRLELGCRRAAWPDAIGSLDDVREHATVRLAWVIFPCVFTANSAAVP